MKKIFKYLFFIFSFIFATVSVYAADIPPIGLNLKNQGDRGIKITSEASKDPVPFLGTIFQNVIMLLFTIGAIGFVIMFLWGAVDWILSGGDKEKIAGARKKMTHALIGLALLSLSFVIINWVGLIVGFNPLGIIQLRNLGDTSGTAVPQ